MTHLFLILTRHARMLLIIVGMAALCRVAPASVLSFGVEAFDGPFPTSVTTAASYYGTQSITFLVAPDQQEFAITGADATLYYSSAYSPVTYTECRFSGQAKRNTCAGQIQYEVFGFGGIDSGVGGDFSVFSNNIETFGEGSGVVELRSGTYTLTAIARTSYQGAVGGEILVPDGTLGSTSANVSVIGGDVSVVPEPDTMVLVLCITVAMIAKWGACRIASREISQSNVPRLLEKFPSVSPGIKRQAFPPVL